ncbi:tRNA (N6-threonylcarbamoyladenosine(37)-N6)-methyltransferase TrmO [Wukongibacter sp. M2B1]|uniref:tRNA (N6-threonylcarbamoyladenosine(37)-N6)-methyltransferase TrmO n=1 Tax=Wukongibacter sp. M2B1 TaxID=3088895 RepID=UPI003D79983B
MSESISLEPIGIIHTNFKRLENMPIQPTGEKASYGKIEVFSKFVEGLKDIDGFSHIIVIYHFHKADRVKLKVKPFLDDNIHGVYATRAPLRPNHIGISVVEIERVDDNCIIVKNIDVLDGTPVLDIKPYIPQFDMPKAKVKTGWLHSSIHNVVTKVSDDRFK